MSQGDEFKLQGGAATNPEREQGNEGGKNCDHAHDGMALARKSLAFLNFQGFEQPQFGHGRKFLRAVVEIEFDTVVDWARGKRPTPSPPTVSRS
jgi:hypothetical protein